MSKKFIKGMSIIISSIGISVSLLTNSVYAFNSDSLENLNVTSIQTTIEDFFYEYETAFDNSNLTTDLYTDYFVSEASAETETNIEVIDTMLYRRIMIKDECPGDLRELNKELVFNYASVDYDSNSASVEVEVTKTFNYASSLDIESATRDTYTILLEKENGVWRISQIENFVDDIMKVQLEDAGVNLNNIDSIRDYRKDILTNVREYFSDTMSTEILSPVETYTAKTTTYDGGAASTYALNHALNYNPDYADFNGFGGDCTNFVSQCLYEGGGLPMHYGTPYTKTCWYYTTSTNRSSSWTGAEELYDYIFSNSSKINANISNWNSVSFGDIIQLTSGGEGYHSLIVSGIQYSSYGKSDLLVCAHTADRRHVSLASYYPGSNKRYIDITSSDL